MNNTRTKLISAALMLTLSLVLLVGASMAWFTVSTAPEISGFQVSMYTDLDLLISKTGQENDFHQSISTASLSAPLEAEGYAPLDNLQFYAPLKPISTAELLHWYIPAYNADGSLDLANFSEANESINANQSIHDLDVDGREYYERTVNGYYVYADVWLKTENEDGVAVTLSVPRDQESLEAWEKGEGEFGQLHGNKYGSFALGKYELKEGNVAEIDNNAQTALRVGFMTFTIEEAATTTVQTIWEPNADQRSDYGLKPKAEDANEPAYILDYALSEETYQDGYYIPTKPIAQRVETDENGQIISATPVVADRPSAGLIIQKKCEWDETLIQTNWANPTSADVETFGRFITDTDSLYTDLDADTGMANISDTEKFPEGLASDTIILTLEHDEVKRVRIFFWLEGQDVDCWNDIASGSFLVNIELAAQPLPEDHVPLEGENNQYEP